MAFSLAQFTCIQLADKLDQTWYDMRPFTVHQSLQVFEEKSQEKTFKGDCCKIRTNLSTNLTSNCCILPPELLSVFLHVSPANFCREEWGPARTAKSSSAGAEIEMYSLCNCRVWKSWTALMNDVLISIHCFGSLCGCADNRPGPRSQTKIFLIVTSSSTNGFVFFDSFVTPLMFDHVPLRKEFLICHPAPSCLKFYLDILVTRWFLCSRTCECWSLHSWGPKFIASYINLSIFNSQFCQFAITPPGVNIF